MDRFILIETSTTLCSVALAEDGRIVNQRSSERDHAARTAPLIREMLVEQGWKTSDCSAVGVSMGPGSFTGLRVGVSTAKGLCFGAGIPLIAVGSLDTLVWQAKEEGLLPAECTAVVPMIDARRMEVYTAVFSPEGKRLTDVEPKIIEAGAYADLLAEGPVLFIGDGAEKCREAIGHPGAYFAGCRPKASAMLSPVLQAFAAGRFEDTAYFEPFYLKDFVATVSRKKLF